MPYVRGCKELRLCGPRCFPNGVLWSWDLFFRYLLRVNGFDERCRRGLLGNWVSSVWGFRKLSIAPAAGLPQRHSSSGWGNAQDDTVFLTGLDQTLDTHDHPVLEPVLSTDNSGQALSNAFISQYFRDTGNGFDPVFHAPHPVTRTDFDTRAVAEPLYLAARLRGGHDESIAVSRDPHRGRHTLTGFTKRREGRSEEHTS